jgi:hypothetical protein
LGNDRLAGGGEDEGEVFVAEKEPRPRAARARAQREPARREVVVAPATVADPDLADAGPARGQDGTQRADGGALAQYGQVAGGDPAVAGPELGIIRQRLPKLGTR